MNPSFRVAVFEQQHCGFGASGRNGGFLSALPSHNLSRMIKQIGLEKAMGYAQLLREAVSNVKTLISEYKIDCEFQEQGMAYVASCEAHVEKVWRQYLLAQKLGYDMEFWSETECRNRLGSPIIKRACYEKSSCTFNPYLVIFRYCFIHIFEGLG